MLAEEEQADSRVIPLMKLSKNLEENQDNILFLRVRAQLSYWVGV